MFSLLLAAAVMGHGPGSALHLTIGLVIGLLFLLLLPGVGLVTDVPDSLKIKYPPKAVDTMIQEDLLFRPRLKRSLPPGAKIVDGYEIRLGARLHASQNVAQIADGGNFPIQKDPTDRQFIFKPTIFAGDYLIGGMLRFIANNNNVAFNGGEMSRRPEETMGNVGKFIEQTYVGTDGTGIRAYVESEPGANQIKLLQTGVNPQGTRLLAENMYISERQSAGGAVRDSIDLRQITNIVHDTRVITYSGADQTPVANDPIYVVPESALAGATLAAMHANGLRGQIDDGTNAQLIHTLDRTAAGNQKLKSTVNSAAGERRNISESLLMAVTHDAARKSKKHASTLLMGEGQTEKYVEHVAPQKRFPATGKGRPGKATGYLIEELSFTSPYGSMEFMLSFDAMPGEINGISWDAFFFYSAVDAQWLSGHDMNNLLLLPGTNGATHRFAWGAYLVSIENWGTDYPLAHFVIRDLKDRLLGD